MIRAIDISKHQGPIDWQRVMTQTDIAGVWIKIGGADDGLYRDPMASEYVQGVSRVGLPWGTYYYVKPSGQASVQAQHAIDCGFGGGVLSPALDLEDDCGFSGTYLDNWALEFLKAVEQRISRRCIIYTGAYIGKGSSYFGVDPRLARYPLWIANYGSNIPSDMPPSTWEPPIPPAWQHVGWSIWQHNSKTIVPGVPQNTVDQNAVKQEFWFGEIGDNQTVFAKEEWMHRPLVIEGESAQYRLVDEGFGVLVRQPIPHQARAGLLAKAGVLGGQEELVVLTDPAEIDDFRSLPVSNAQGTADVAALKLATAIITEVQKIGMPENWDVDEAGLARQIIQQLVDRWDAIG